MGAIKSTSRLGEALGDFFTKDLTAIFRKSETAVTAAAPAAKKGWIGSAGEWMSEAARKSVNKDLHFVGDVYKGSAKLAWNVVQFPFVAALEGTRFGVKGIGSAFRKFPKTSWGLTAIAALGTAGAWLGSRAEAKSAQYYQAQAANLQTTAVANSYMNSASADEVAAMDARMKQSGTASFADAAQQRAAAAQNATAV